MTYLCTIPGQPASAGRPRVTRYGVYASKAAKAWRERAVPLMRRALRRPMPDGPVEVRMSFAMARPKRLIPREHGGSQTRAEQRAEQEDGAPWPTSRPDGDNLEKLVLDCLVRAGVLSDDSVVVACAWTKEYADVGEAPHTIVEVSWL